MADRSLAYWGAGVANRDAMADDQFQTFLAHPNWAAACKSVEKAILDLSPAPNTAPILRDMGGTFYGIFSLYLDARGGLTLTAIQDFCKEAGLSSPGRATALLFQLRTKGFVTRDKTLTDRRVRRYIPAPALVDAMRNVFLTNLNALRLICPEAQTFIDRMHEPEIFREFLLGIGEGLANLVKRNTRTPVTLFAERNFGIQVLYHMTLSGVADDVYPPKGPVQMSVTDIVARLPASRSHVLKLLRDAERQGFLKRDNEHSGVLNDVLRDSLVNFHAVMLMGLAHNANRALTAIGSAAKMSAIPEATPMAAI